MTSITDNTRLTPTSTNSTTNPFLYARGRHNSLREILIDSTDSLGSCNRLAMSDPTRMQIASSFLISGSSAFAIEIENPQLCVQVVSVISTWLSHPCLLVPPALCAKIYDREEFPWNHDCASATSRPLSLYVYNRKRGTWYAGQSR